MKLSKLEVPKEIMDTIEEMKNDDEAIRKYGSFERRLIFKIVSFLILLIASALLFLC